jgi:hypothetical protein
VDNLILARFKAEHKILVPCGDDYYDMEEYLRLLDNHAKH